MVQGRKQSMEGEQGRGGQEVNLPEDAEVSQNLAYAMEEARLALAAPLPAGLERGTLLFKALLRHTGNFSMVGRAMAWMVFNFPRLVQEREVPAALSLAVTGKLQCNAMHRGFAKRCKSLFPLPLGDVSSVRDAAMCAGLEEFCQPHFAGLADEDVWRALSLLMINGVAGFGRACPDQRPTAGQQAAGSAVAASIKRVLCLDETLSRTPEEAEKELSSRYLNYTGEEVPKMQVLQVASSKVALPPKSHGGSIDAKALVCAGTRRFLEHPEEALLDKAQDNIKLQAKVHIAHGEELEFCKMLVDHNICRWLADEDVQWVGGQPILNGLFGVGKGSYLDDGREIQRVIMNLVPANSVLKQAQGGTSDLPSITQYLSLVMKGEDTLAFHQSDMSSAFYLFAIPPGWSRVMAFNIKFRGSDIGLNSDQWFRPACAVIPMGWSSAVSIMQELAERLTVLGKLPQDHRVRRTSPLPSWLTQAAESAANTGQAWYHVYLDNFCAMSRNPSKSLQDDGAVFHQQLEQAWENVGVLSSQKKRVSQAPVAQELGAMLSGPAGVIGPSPLRLLKLIQSTLVMLSKPRLRKKWLQVLAGRWVHVMSFRRPCMICLDETWRYISGTGQGNLVEARVRSELLGCCMGCLLVHTNLRAAISEVTTASDASSTGGAVGQSKGLTSMGCEFAAADLGGRSSGKVIPVLVLSLFNGIGCCFRSYDLCGVSPLVCISYEINAAANRVTSRRWPQVILKGDVKLLTLEAIQEWRYLYPQVEEIHIWSGFPCNDLSSAKYGRMNLAGADSGLFWEFVRMVKSVRQVYGFGFRVLFAGENVAGMDVEAEQEISRTLGVKPLRLDPWGVVPIHRPRFCWMNIEPTYMEGVYIEEKERFWEVTIEHEYPHLDQWLQSGAEWPGYEQRAVLPTCMKAIKRSIAPPKPAGLERVSADGRLRWQADDMRFPPYQYGDKFIIWVNNNWRLINADERELLHGLGAGHTKLCWSAGDIKRDPVGYEDARKTLVGDSFNCFSFCYIAAMLCKRWITVRSFHQLWNRTGMAPGFCCPLEVEIPLQRTPSYGSTSRIMGIKDLHACLLRRVNHTGSDIRISSGSVMNPKAFPRQSVVADWWQWDKVFAYRWSRDDHINSLELRSLIHAVEWRVKHLKERATRLFHLTDSYVVMSICSKGRTSSRMLKPLLQRLSALLLAFDLYLLVAHVESSENPTDNASRS